MNPSRAARRTRLWRAAIGGEIMNLIQLNPSRGARQTRLRRAAIGWEFIFNLIKSNYFELLYTTHVCA